METYEDGFVRRCAHLGLHLSSVHPEPEMTSGSAILDVASTLEPMSSPYARLSASPPSSSPLGDSCFMSSSFHTDEFYGANTASPSLSMASTGSPFSTSDSSLEQDPAVFSMSPINATFFHNYGSALASHHPDAFPSAGGVSPGTVSSTPSSAVSPFSDPSPQRLTPDATHFAPGLLYPHATAFLDDWLAPVYPKRVVTSTNNHPHSSLLLTSSTSPTSQTFSLPLHPLDDAGLGDLDNLRTLPHSRPTTPPPSHSAHPRPAMDWPSNHPGRASTKQYFRRTKLHRVPPNLQALPEDLQGNSLVPMVLVLKVLLYEHTMLHVKDIYEVLRNRFTRWCERRDEERWKGAIRTVLYKYHSFVRIPFANGKGYYWFFDYTKGEGFKGQASTEANRRH